MEISFMRLLVKVRDLCTPLRREAYYVKSNSLIVDFHGDPGSQNLDMGTCAPLLVGPGAI